MHFLSAGPYWMGPCSKNSRLPFKWYKPEFPELGAFLVGGFKKEEEKKRRKNECTNAKTYQCRIIRLNF